MACQLNWGSATFAFERKVFEHGFQCGRNCYFYEMDGARFLNDTELLTIIASKDEHGHYRIDESLLEYPEDGTEELLGTLIGYLSGPIIPESLEERAERLSFIVEMISD